MYSRMHLSMDRACVHTGTLRIQVHESRGAAGDATSRGVFLASTVLKGEIGYPSALSAPTWGFYDVNFKGNEFSFQRPFGSYVMEHILFKISFPAEFHAQNRG